MATRLKRAESPTVVYVYGVSAKSAALPRLIGVDGRSALKSIECAGLTCWISHVPQSEFADNLAANMENLDWLSGAGVRHQKSLSAIAKVVDILPARFGTVFLNEASLETDIRGRKKTLLGDLRKIKGCEEWGIKVFATQPTVTVPSKQPKSGRDYLANKAELMRRRNVGIAPEELDFFAEALQAVSVATADGGKITGGQRGLQWQTSMLLKRGGQAKLQRILKKYAARWNDSAKIECTGPWPPYSFVTRST